jgi:intron-binding protein aquarius
VILDIILSLTRTTRVGYLRDIRRLTVALSRARLGLYILGRRTVFESCHELREAFSRLLSGRPDKLMVVTGEMYGGVARLVGDKVESTEMTGVEHMGQYVYEMTKAKIEASSTQGQALAESRPLNADIADAVGDSEGEYGKEEVEEQQPEALDLLG